MATVNNNTSTTGATSYTSKGFSGLVSGMDTEALVEAMTGDVQKKIDKVKKQQQTYTWKQEAYREVINALTNFQSKYFSYASSTNLLSSSLFNTTSMVAGGSNASAISLSGTSTTTSPTYSITGISQLASKASMTSGGDLSKSNITTGEITFGDRIVCAAAGGSIAIKYGGSAYQVNISSDVSALTAEDMATALNDAMKSVSLSIGGTLGEKLAFSATGETLSLGYTGEDSNSFSISGGTTATLTALGFSTGAESVSGKITASNPVSLSSTVAFSLAGKSLDIDLNGVSKTIQFTNDDTAVTDIATLKDLVQQKINKAFGEGKIYVSESAPGSGELSFKTVKDKTDPPTDDSMDHTSVLKISSSSNFTLGTNGVFNLENGVSNRLDTSKKISEFSGFTPEIDGTYTINVNGKSFTFMSDTEIGTVINTINSDEEVGVNISYLKTSGRFNITADESGAQGKLNIYDEKGGLAEALFGELALYNPAGEGTKSALVKDGTDLNMTIRYEGSIEKVEIVRSTNGVSIDGVNFTAKSEFAAADTASEISFTASSQPEKLVEAIKSMVEDYNALIDTLTKYTETKKDKNYTYEPLTDAQKKKMTADEITKWETKAKEGLLFGDRNLTSLASDMRFIFFTSVKGVGEASSIGIKSSSTYSDNGKIILDEEKLKAAIASDPEKVKKIFTATAEQSGSVDGNGYLAGGLATRLKTVTEAYAKSTGSYKGKLVQLAGIKNNATTNDNYISRQQNILTNKLEYLEDLLKTRQDRYQRKFTKLETYISKMNAQSSWLYSSTNQG